MALSNKQYDGLMDVYENIRRKNRLETERRRAILSAQDPEFDKINEEIGVLSYEAAKNKLLQKKESQDDTSSQNDKYNDKMNALKKRMSALLIKHGKPEDWLEPVYDCEICHDTGVTDDFKNCSCFTKRAIELLYKESNLINITQGHTFDRFNADLYSDELIDPITGFSSRELAKTALNIALKYVKDFDTLPTSDLSETAAVKRNLFISGNTGLGKTFLSACIASDLIKTAHSVIYLTAENYFSRMDTNDEHSPLLECDLLIIDDLGTEYNNAYTAALIFHGINERLLRNKHTIISTNLNFEQIRERYTDRVLSRIYRNFTAIRFFGDDIRMK